MTVITFSPIDEIFERIRPVFWTIQFWRETPEDNVTITNQPSVFIFATTRDDRQAAALINGLGYDRFTIYGYVSGQ